jgi:ElaB/YqjD/DUF883 family membrane-anchored ribosome-binding protein
MFHHRSSVFAPRISVIEAHLRSLEKELEKVGRRAGRRTSAATSAAGDQMGDAIATILSEMVDRFRNGRRLAGDEAARLGNEAVRIGTRIGNDTLQRIAAEVEHRPLVTLAVAVGVGILVGLASHRR